MISNSSMVGKTGEDMACEYLVKNGYKILERNHKEKWDEIDIISRNKDEMLIFFEVKSLRFKRSKNDDSENMVPEDNMTSSKLKKLKRACEMFAAKHSDLINNNVGWRIDLLALTINEKNVTIKHYENIVAI